MVQHSPAIDGSFIWLRAARAVVLIYLALVPVFFWRGAVDPFESCKVGLLHLVGLLVAGCLVCAGRPLRDRFWREPIGLGMLLSLASAVVSTAFSISPRASFFGGWDSHQGLLTVASLFVLFLASRSLFDVRDLPSIVAALAVGVFVCAGYAAVQALSGDPLVWVDSSPFAGFTRPIGTLGHPNYLAGFLVMALPLLLWSFATTRHRVILFAIALASAVVVASLSRAAWLAAGLLLALPFARMPRRKQVWIGTASVALLAVVVVLAWLNLLGPLGARIRNVADSSSRTAMWKVAGRIFLDAPLTGSGVDTFQLAFARHRSTEYWQHEFGYTPTHAHNDPLDLLATQGALGLGCYLFLAGAIVFTARRAWQHRPGERGPILALCGVSLAYFAQNWFGFPVIATASLHALALGCLSRLGDPQSEESARVMGNNWPIAVAAVLACLVLPINLALESVLSEAFWLPVALAVLVGWLSNSLDWSRRESPRERWRLALWQGGVVAAVVVASWVVVVRPFTAWCLIRHGQDTLDADARQALASFERAVSTAPWLDTPLAQLADARHRAATVYGQLDLLPSAMEAAERARDAVPANPMHHAAVGRMALDLVREGKAQPEAVWRGFDESLALDPRNSLLLVDAARAAFILGDVERARAYLARGKTLAPNLAPLIAEQGVLAIAEGRLSEAEVLLRSTVGGQWYKQTEAEGRARGLLAAVCFQQGKYGEAVTEADEALTTHPSPNTYEVATRWVRAASLERLGAKTQAREEAIRVLALRPDHAQARELLKRTE